MKRKIFSTLLMGAFFIASMSMFTRYQREQR